MLAVVALGSARSAAATRFEWAEQKAAGDLRKHALSFEEASGLFTSGVDYLEIFDADHSDEEERFICIGPIARGIVLVVIADVDTDPIRILSARGARLSCTVSFSRSVRMRDDMSELSASDFERSISAHVRRRVAEGRVESGSDVVAIRRFLGLTEGDFAHAFGVALETLHDWEAGRSRPDGPALSLLRVAARHPRAVRENVPSAA